MSRWSLLIFYGALLAAPTWAQSEAYRQAAALASLGPRTPGSVAHSRARLLLLNRLREMGLAGAGLGGTREEARGWHNVIALLPGSVQDEILLIAHYDTVPGSPGAVDDASGCAVILTAVDHLRRVPLRHSLRVVLSDGEESGEQGSRQFLSRRAADAPRITAVVDLDMIGIRDVRRGIIHILPASATNEPIPPPAWLAAAALQTARQNQWHLVMGDSLFPVLGQLSERAARSRFRADAGAFSAQQIPAILLSDMALFDFDGAYHTPRDVPSRLDPERLDDWSDYVVALVRRIDELPRPAAADEPRESDYLVIADRVWRRPILQGIASGLAVLLLVMLWVRHWRRPSGDRFPGVAFAGLAAVAGIFVPVSSTVLLTPALLMGLAAPRPSGRGVPGLAIGLAAPVLLCAFGVAALIRGWSNGWYIHPLAISLNGFALVSYVVWRCRWTRPRWMMAEPAVSDRATPPAASREMP